MFGKYKKLWQEAMIREEMLIDKLNEYALKNDKLKEELEQADKDRTSFAHKLAEQAAQIDLKNAKIAKLHEELDQYIVMASKITKLDALIDYGRC